MSRFVTLCALTRLQCHTPSQHPMPPLEHDRKHAASVWQGRRRRSSRKKTCAQEVKLFDISWAHARSKVTWRAAFCPAIIEVVRQVRPRWQEVAASLLSRLYFWGFIMKINTLSKLLAPCHIIFNWTDPLQVPLIRVRPVYWFAYISGWYTMKASH